MLDYDGLLNVSGVTFSCIWVSLTAYTAVSVPSISLATVQGILHGVYFGLGNGSGHLIGGLLIGAFGARVTFYGFSGASFLVLVLFIIAQKVSWATASSLSDCEEAMCSHPN